ncbi:MAG: hypothetical protein AAGD05_04910, partial [Bacteroidota bacterium]
FDIGRFELILETIPDDPAQAIGRRISSSEEHIHQLLARAISGMEGQDAPELGRIPQMMELCRSCDQFIFQHEVDCPHCGTNVEQAKAQHEADTAKRKEAIDYLENLFSQFLIEERELTNE